MDLINAQMMEHVEMIAICCIWGTVSGSEQLLMYVKVQFS